MGTSVPEHGHMAAITQNFENWKANLDKKLHEKNKFTDLLEVVEKKTNVRRLYLVLGLAAFLAFYLMIGYGADFLCNLIGFVYPAYASVKAIESNKKEDDTKWLTYWVVYSTFSILEFFGDIFFFWVPFYSFCKCGFLIYCMIPGSYNGSLKIYSSVLRPFFLKHQDKMEQALNEASSVASDMVNEAKEAGADLAADAMRQSLADSSKSD